MRTMLRSRTPLLFMTFAVILFSVAALAVGLSLKANAQTAPPSIQSDQADYPPGATVTLTGANWVPGDTIHIVVDDSTGHTWQHTADVTADASGGIQDVFSLPNTFISNYSVTATDTTNGTDSATASFTDADNTDTTLNAAPNP